LIAYWDFNDASNPALARDAGGGSHSATINGPLYTSSGGGRTGLAGDRALSFNGSGSVQVPDAAVGMFNSVVAHNAITLSCDLRRHTQPANCSVFWAAAIRMAPASVNSTPTFPGATVWCIGTRGMLRRRAPPDQCGCA